MLCILCYHLPLSNSGEIHSRNPSLALHTHTDFAHTLTLFFPHQAEVPVPQSLYVKVLKAALRSTHLSCPNWCFRVMMVVVKFVWSFCGVSVAFLIVKIQHLTRSSLRDYGLT